MIQPQTILQDVFGYRDFRPEQLEIIEHALSDQDGLVIMPTGGGKSICFQIPAIIKSNLTLVISPLISLMKDQVESLRAHGVEVALYNSSITDTQRREVRRRALSQEIKLLYISPETLLSNLEWISQIKVSLIAVDEAHCVSMWGHDFRPEYQQIGELRKHFSNVPLMAFTATADKITRKDIASKLNLKEHSVFISSFDRPNLSLAVRPQIPKKDKEKEILEFIKNRPSESGIIYCLSRKETEAWSNLLNANGIVSRFYHAGLSSDERSKVQEDFINDDNHIICATIAFGMGIDKANVRWVIHNNLPKNIEGYYQEIGRAGRDGKPSETILYYNYRDVVLLNDFVKESEFKEVYHEKINRMLKYAEATTCRRKILLAYFGEQLIDDCGNCDICANPPDSIDGTVIAQKAISAVIRSKESLGSTLLVNVLRGAKTIEIIEKGLDKLRTYGAGKEYTFKEWHHYVNQLINQGVFEIAYDNHLRLKCTPSGEAIVKNKQSINLTQFEEKHLQTKKDKKKKAETATNLNLLGILKEWRKEKAKANGVPAYVILHDTSLTEIVTSMPTELKQLANITGFGKVKIDRFGQEIIQLVVAKGSPKLSTFEHTLKLYESNLDISEIAKNRNLSEQTIYNHLIKLFEDGKPVNLFKYITEYELQQIKKIRKSLKQTHQLKPIHDALNGEIDYHKIGMALAILDRQN